MDIDLSLQHHFQDLVVASLCGPHEGGPSLTVGHVTHTSSGEQYTHTLDVVLLSLE